MQKNEQNNTERLMLLGIGATLLILLLLGGIAWKNATEAAASTKLVAHTFEVGAQLSRAQSMSERAERSQWGFYLTRNVEYIGQRDDAVRELRASLNALLNLTKDNPKQLQRVQELQTLVEKRIDLLMWGERTYLKEGLPAILPAFKIAQEMSSQITDLNRAAAAEEQSLLVQRKDAEVWRVKLIAGSTICLLALLALLSVWIRGVMRSRLRVDKALHGLDRPLFKTGVLQTAIYNSENFSIIATDALGVIQIFNVGAENMLGYAAADVVDKVTPAEISDQSEIIARADFLSKELNTPIAPGFDALVFKASRGIEDIYELTYLKKDGSRLPAIVSVTALHDTVNKIIGYLLIGTDNTIRKQVETEQRQFDHRLQEQQFYTRSLIEANIDALITTDASGVITDVNQEMKNLTGCERTELIGSPFKSYFTDPLRAEEGINRVLKEGKVKNFELTAQSKSGKQTVVSYNATIFNDSHDKLVGVFASARDITNRKDYEKSLQKNNAELKLARAAADKANLAKSEFLSSMSHELRTPLNAVLGFAQLMASDQPPPTPTQKISIDQILQAGWYLLRLINEILDLAMIESGKVSLSQEPMSLTDVLQDCEAMITPQASKRGIRVTFPDFSELYYVHADRVRVKQVMINLLSNAIKYNRDGGSVKVECQQLNKRKVRISVTDTGLGLTTKQIEQLFQPFNRLGQESSGEEGTGIGLVVTKQLVELMGGEIGVESQLGVGSLFWVELVASSAADIHAGFDVDNGHEAGLQAGPNTASEIAVEGAEKRGAPRQKRLLYVEDNPANLILVERIIARRSDVVLFSAIDGHLGIKMAREHRPDVILMDINLPGISGYGALKVLLADVNTKHIPVMALSANAMPRDIEMGMQAGFFCYLTKPIDVTEFMDALDLALRFSAEQGFNPNRRVADAGLVLVSSKNHT